MGATQSIVKVLIVALATRFCEGHGYMSMPQSRNLYYGLGPAVPPGLPSVGALGAGNVQNLNGGIGGGGGGQAAWTEFGHAVCGDVPTRPGGPAFQSPFSQPWDGVTPIQGTYVAGGPIEISVHITAKHLGWFEFRLCESDNGGADMTNDELKACLNQNVLKFWDVNEIKNQFPQSAMPGGWNYQVKDPTDYQGSNPWTKCSGIPGAPDGSCCNDGGNCSPPDQNMDRYMLPTNEYLNQIGGTVTAKYKIPETVSCENCVLQWYWQTGNSPSSWPETFWNCADIKVLPAGSAPIPSPVPNPVAAPVTAPVAAPVASPVSVPTTTNGGGSCQQETSCDNIKATCQGYCNAPGKGGVAINQCWGTGGSFAGDRPADVYQLCKCGGGEHYIVPGSACLRQGSIPEDSCPQGENGECLSACCRGGGSAPVASPVASPVAPPSPAIPPTPPVLSPTPPPVDPNTCAAEGQSCNTAWCELPGFKRYCCCAGTVCNTGTWVCDAEGGGGGGPPVPAPTYPPTEPPTTEPPTPTGMTNSPVVTPPHGAENARLIAYVGNWQTCPSAASLKHYTHVLISFGVTYTWNAQKNQCSQTCEIGSPVPLCGNSASGTYMDELKAMGIKVILSFGGAGMGGSWSGDPNDCWQYCFGNVDNVVSQLVTIVNQQGFDGVDIDYEYFFGPSSPRPAPNNKVTGTESITFLTELTQKLRAQLPPGSELTHAPMDSDLVKGTPYYNIIKNVASSLDFLMPQYYNGVTRPKTDGFNPSNPPAGRMSVQTHYSDLVNDIFGGDATKVVFGFCNGDCSGTGSNIDGASALSIMQDLTGQFPVNGGAFFWVASDDINGVWSKPLYDYLAPQRNWGAPVASPTTPPTDPPTSPPVPSPTTPGTPPVPDPTRYPTLKPTPEPTKQPTQAPAETAGVCAAVGGSCNPNWCELGGQYAKYCCCAGSTCEAGIWKCALSGAQNPGATAKPTAHPVPAPTPPPTDPTAEPTPMPVGQDTGNVPGLHDGKNVIYMEWKLEWSDMTKDLEAAVGVGYNVINFRFWKGAGPVNAALQWTGVNAAKRAEALQYVHDKGGIVMVSAAGAREDFDDIVKNPAMAKTYCEGAAQWAIYWGMDGVDFDFQFKPGHDSWQPLSNDGGAIEWISNCSKFARAYFTANGVSGKQYYISHAPQGRYLGTWACGGIADGCKNGYTEVYKQSNGAIDWFNIQYFNQGAGVYDDYESLFIHNDNAVGLQTSVKELNANGIPMSAIVVGKPLHQIDASDGHMGTSVLQAYVKKAKSELGWNGGTMFTMWDPTTGAQKSMEYGAMSASALINTPIGVQVDPNGGNNDNNNNNGNDNNDDDNTTIGRRHSVEYALVITAIVIGCMIFICLGLYVAKIYACPNGPRMTAQYGSGQKHVEKAPLFDRHDIEIQDMKRSASNKNQGHVDI